LRNDFREYENGVADVLAFLAGDGATVERNVQIRGRRSGRLRQVDVLVRVRIFAISEEALVVDCKRRARPIDVKDVESFIGFLDDVGAAIGLLVTTLGASAAARHRASQERGVQLDVLSLDELRVWSPPGTVTTTFRLPVDAQSEAERAFRERGFRVRPDSAYPPKKGEVVVAVFRHYGTLHPSADVQREQMDRTRAVLTETGIAEPVLVSHGITIGGGTPATRWLEVAADGIPTGLKICAANEAEAEKQLDRVADCLLAGVPGARSAISVIKPDDWPVRGTFGSRPT
jgi:hypothetical protein